MNFLIVTQKVDKNDPVLGFFHRWIEEFAKHCEKVFVICLHEGEHDLPDNVGIYSLGKEFGRSRFLYIFHFYLILWRLRGKYDNVFVHMNQVYVILGGIFWRSFGLPVGLWYAHRAKTFSLWLAEKFTNVVFTNTSKSFAIVSKKIVTLGHGVDIRMLVRPRDYSKIRSSHTLLCVGRLTPIKDQETVIRACGILSRDKIDLTCTFIGGPATDNDKSYKKKLLSVAYEEGVETKVFFNGNLPQNELLPFYWESAIHINACPTGGMDKVVIESAVGGAIPIVANESFREFLEPYSNRLIFREGDAESLAECVRGILVSEDQEVIRATIGKRAREDFDIVFLIKKIVNWYETTSR